METKAVFQDIQPLCINVAKNLDLQSVQDLDKYLTSLLAKEKLGDDSISVLDDLKEYISFPLVMILKKQNSSSGRKDVLLEAVLQCLGKVLLNCFSVEWHFFHDVFILLFLCITSSENPQLVDNVTEECKIEALKNVTYLCKALSQDQRMQLCSESFRPQLGHAVYVCLKIAEKEKNRDLILTSLKTLEELGSKATYDYDVEFVNTLSHTWANFLPGIVTSTTRIATRKEIQVHKITVAALQCWQCFVCLVMRDEFLSAVVKNFAKTDSLVLLQRKLNIEENLKNENISKLVNETIPKSLNASELENCENSGSKKLKNVNLDSDWVKTTSERVYLLTKSICDFLVSHDHWNVRMTLSLLCHFLLQSCPRSLEKCIVLCLETLITLKSDPILDVCEDAEKSLKSLKIYSFFADDVKFRELLEERLFAISTRLPNIIKTQDDANLLVSIRQLNGFLEIMGGKIDEFVQISSHLQRLLHSLIVLFTYDYSDNDILLEKIISEDSLEIMSIKPSLGFSFRYFQSDVIFRCASDCCSLIGQHGDILLIVDHCLDIISDSSAHRNEAILLLNLILQGKVNDNRTQLLSQEKEIIVCSIFDLLTNLKFLESPVSNSGIHNSKESDNSELHLSLVSYQTTKTSLPVQLIKINIVLINNVLKLISSCALFMRKDFCVFLSKILCPVMEKAGENNVLIAHSALNCLENIALSCGYGSVPVLIEKSAHLFWFDLSQKLKRLPEYPSSPQVLRVVLKNHHKEMKFVEDLVEDVLETLDTYYHESSLPLLLVLLSYVDTHASSVQKDKSSEELQSLDKESRNWEKTSVKMFIENLHDKHKTAQNEFEQHEREEEENNNKVVEAESGFQNHFDKPNLEKDEDNQNNFQEEKKFIPKNISLTVEILERCSYLLFGEDRKSQLIILDLIKHCFVILKDYEDEKLPCCHKIWKPLVLRLKGKDYIVFLKALEICLLMVKSSKDFLRSRFLKELFPSLTYFLESQSSISLNKTRQSGYFHTPSYKAQSHVLSDLPDLLQYVKISLLDAETLMQGILLYLDERQPVELNRLASVVLETIKTLHPDLVWLALAFMKEPFRITSSDPSLNNIYINGCRVNNLCNSVFELFDELSQQEKNHAEYF